MKTGWASSYPETTGYIVPTLIQAADQLGEPGLHARARRMLDWLVSIQFENGGFQGGTVDAKSAAPVTFNTGQILLGLAAGTTSYRSASYGPAMRRSAEWLAATQDGDGAWRKHATQFAAPGEKAYETHVAWGLFEADRVETDQGWGEAGLRQVRWALGKQEDNGWMRDCCLSDPSQPLTHTLGYALRGVLEAWRLSGSDDFLASARRLADGLGSVVGEDGFLPGRIDRNWRGTVPWACLTGSAQLAACWFILHEATREERYRELGRRCNRYVRRTLVLSGDPNIVGGVKGSFPIEGGYGSWEYLNWAAKFFVDANLIELRQSASGQARSGAARIEANASG